MQVITAMNVREALPKAVEYVMRYGLREETRLGPAYVSPGPVTIMYLNPKHHVLLNSVRDANPFFHLMEAMWMLAGRQDGAFLDHYIKDFSKIFGKEGVIDDAYGYRWRRAMMFDQLEMIIQQLRENPHTRQCVLQMWGANAEYTDHDLISNTSKPCNLVCTFRIMNNEFLDMSVFNRSNDLIWGCCGANAVHFPMLQEYVAGKLRLKMGAYWQISTNLHLYHNHIKMLAKRFDHIEGIPLAEYLRSEHTYEQTMGLASGSDTFDSELDETLSWIEDIQQNKEVMLDNIANTFLRHVVLPMALAHQCFKNDDRQGSYQHIETVAAQDWQTAGMQWLDRRYDERQRRSSQA